jgi:PTS system mannose-specific IIB component
MPIVLVRVDERLIHGQILEGWLPSTKAQEVLIANDNLAHDELQIMIMESAIPNQIRLIVDSVERIASILISEASTDLRRMVIVDNPIDALRLKKAGVKFDNLNLGNFRAERHTTSISRNICLGGETLEAICNIIEEGVAVNVQSVPFEKPIDFFDICSCTSKM